MSLLKKWRDVAYSKEVNEVRGGQDFWQPYFLKEQAVYRRFLAEPDKLPKLSLKDFAAAYDMDVFYATGFVDGISGSLVHPVDVETMTEDTVIDFSVDLEQLYKDMVEARADWLYELEEWDAIFPEKKRKELYLEQRKSGTVVNENKVGRNDPCPCGSGKKYKKCCGR
ncbi:MAG: SEC-C metal-binding domain-containing protein [Eubacteriales bacterium]|nr:SEC-C metal-binding domain-containing protein [Eubacteriales bacterium]